MKISPREECLAQPLACEVERQYRIRRRNSRTCPESARDGKRRFSRNRLRRWWRRGEADPFAGGKILNSGETRSSFLLPGSALGYHLSVSEEHETELRCGIELRVAPADPVKASFGALLRALPGCDLKGFDRVRPRLQMPEVGGILRDLPARSEEGVRTLLSFLLETLELLEFALQTLPPARFEYGCSAESLKKTAFQMLGREELEKLLAENPNPVLQYRFCNAKYHLSAQDLPECRNS